MKKKTIFGFLAALAAGAFVHTAAADEAVPGMWQALYTSGQSVTTGDPIEDGEIVPGALFCSTNSSGSSLSYTVGDKTYTMGGSTTAAYKGMMMFQGGVTYHFMKYFDDWGRLQIIDPETSTTTTLINNGTWSSQVHATFTSEETKFYWIELRVGNGSGGIGPSSSTGPYFSLLHAGFVWNTNGLDTCTTDNYTLWHRFMNGEKDGNYLFTGIPNYIPVFENKIVSVSGMSVTLSATLASGRGEMTLVVTDTDGTAMTKALGSFSEAGAAIDGTLTGLTSGKSYSVGIRSVSDYEVTSYADFGTIYLGNVSVAKVGDADAAALTDGSFRISRPTDSEATHFDLEVAFTLSGATAGTNFTEIPLTATIPAGESSVDVVIRPIWTADDKTLTLTLTSGLRHFVGTASASLTIKGSEYNQRVRYVSLTGSDDNDGLTPETAYATIRHAVHQFDLATAQSTVYVLPGTHKMKYYDYLSATGSSRVEVNGPVAIIGTGDTPDDVILMQDTSDDSQNARIVYLNNPLARIENLTLDKGVATNKGRLDGFYENAAGRGGNLFIDTLGGEAYNCVIKNGQDNHWASGGCNIYMAAGRVSRCVITGGSGSNNRNRYTTADYSYSGTAACMYGGIMENCLVYGNGVNTKGGNNNGCTIALFNDSKLVNCTITANYSDYCAGVVLWSTDAAMRNCAIFGNTTLQDESGHGNTYVVITEKSKDDDTNAKYRAICKACASEIAINEDCFTAAEGGFVDPGSGDYRLGTASICRDNGMDYASTAAISDIDLDGLPRIMNDKVDIGCYEFDTDKLSVDFVADVTSGLVPATVTFTAYVNGKNLDGLQFVWNFGDGTSVTTTQYSVTHVYTQSGYGSVTLDVTTTSEAAGASKSDYILTGPPHLYCNPTNAVPEYPYDTPAKASPRIDFAIDTAVDGSYIHLADGVYEINTTIPTPVVNKGIKVVGDSGDPGRVILTNTFNSWPDSNHFNNLPILEVGHADAFVANMSLAGGYRENTGAAGLTITAAGGTVSNVWIYGGHNIYNRGCSVPGAYIAAGLLTHAQIWDEHCCVTNGAKSISGYNSVRTQGAELYGYGRIENTLFRDMHSEGSIVYIQSSTASMKNCTIVNCTVTFTCGNNWKLNELYPRCCMPAYGINNTGGSQLYNCVVYNVDRIAYTDHFGWTIPYTNAAPYTLNYNFMDSQNSSFETYTNKWANNFPKDTGRKFRNCATDGDFAANDTCQLISDADFVDFAGGDFTPEKDGKLYDKGQSVSGWSSITDLAKNPRVRGRKIDIGCYEQQESGELPDVYVDVDYSGDESDGSIDAPWKTLSEGLADATAGKKVYVRGGGRKYVFATAADAVEDGTDGTSIVGCNADWEPITDWAQTNDMPVLVVSDTCAAVPITISAANITMSGFKCEYGEVLAGGSLILVGASGFTLENCHIGMKDSTGGRNGAGTFGVVRGKANTRDSTKSIATDCTLRRCYAAPGKYRAGISLYCHLGDGARVENCLLEGLDTLFANSGLEDSSTRYCIVSNIFLNCSGTDAAASGYTRHLISAAGNTSPGGGEIAYNRFIHNDGVDGYYRLLQHGAVYNGCWNKSDTYIHHNTVVGYEVGFDAPLYDNGKGTKVTGYVWQPMIFDNLLCGTTDAINESATGQWTEGQDVYKSSFKSGSRFLNNALNCENFVAGSATGFAWYDITATLADTDTTIFVDSMPRFINTVDPTSVNYYKMKVPQCPWVLNAWTGDDPVYQEFPRYIGAVEPQPGGWAVRIR